MFFFYGVFTKEKQTDLELVPEELCILLRPFLDFRPALQSTPLPLPRASNLTEKLIICHIASVLSRTPMRSSGSSRNNSLSGLFKQGFGCSVGHQTWPVNTQSHLDVLKPFWLHPMGTLETRFPFHCDSSQWDNAATLFLSTPNKVTQKPLCAASEN